LTKTIKNPKPTRSMASMFMEKLYCWTCRRPLIASPVSAAKTFVGIAKIGARLNRKTPDLCIILFSPLKKIFL
jgi:hypothetical protein